jgi:hypothetical protein
MPESVRENLTREEQNFADFMAEDEGKPIL